ASDANVRERGPVSDQAWGREAREERGWTGGRLAPRGAGSLWPDAPAQPALGRAWPLLLITLIALLYPFEYDTGLTNYSLGDPVVGPIALFVVLRSLVRPVRWPRYVVQLLALVLVAIASSLVNAFSPAIYFSAPSALGETAKLFSAGLWMCVIFWLLADDFSRGFYQLACSSAVLATGFAISSLWVTVRETSDYRPTGPFGAVVGSLVFLGMTGAWYVQQQPRVLRRLEYTAEGSGPNIENRLELWHAGREAFTTRPILGVGYGQLRNYVELATGNNKPV